MQYLAKLICVDYGTAITANVSVVSGVAVSFTS